MGHQIGKTHRPHRGSLQYWPRKRAKRIYPSVASWPDSKEVIPLAFAGYKAGMTRVFIVDNRKNSLTKGEELAVPVTIIEAPPVKVVGLRLYSNGSEGLRAVSEFWVENPGKELAKKISLPKKKSDSKKVDEAVSKASQVRVIIQTQPHLARIGKRKPEIFEVRIGGDVVSAFSKAKELLNNEIKVSDIFSEGEFVDSFSVSKGKGFHGVVRRFGVRIMQHKAEKVKRKVGTLGSWTPKKVDYTVAQAGQMGFHSRAEYNKQIIKIGTKLEVKGGLVRYGQVSNDYLLVFGSVPGSRKRLIILRKAVRPSKTSNVGPREVTHILLRSQQ